MPALTPEIVRGLLPRLRGFLRRERLLGVFGLLALFLALADPRPWALYRNWLDLPTLLGLAALLVTVEGIRASGYVQRAARYTALRTRSLRGLALLLVLASALLAMLLTNDVSLFLVVPLTVALGREARLPVQRLVIFEALAVNAGSTLSPIGNPQNLLLWQRSGLSMPGFMLHLLPTFAVMLALLLALVWFMFDARALTLQTSARTAAEALPRPALGVTAGLLLLVVVGLLQGHHAQGAAALVLAVFAVMFREVLQRVDWMLLATFAAMFVGLGHLAQILPVQGLGLQQPGVLYIAAIALSQVISNVPATVLLEHGAHDVMLLAAAVNVGGFGLGIGSLANLIALRLEGSPGSLARFHRISVPFLLVCAPLVWLVLRWVA
jgi:Na+/H+ antiporter NhaD/arsenite permease-like protein